MMTIGIALGIRSERCQYDPMDALPSLLASIICDANSPIATFGYILPKNALCLAVDYLAVLGDGVAGKACHDRHAGKLPLG